MKNILELEWHEARKFFMKQESYSTIELPSYFVFNNLLEDVANFFNTNILKKEELDAAKDYETVNHVLFGNKDGKFAWRKYEIINPLIYTSLVNIICEEKNWIFLKRRFKVFRKDKNIECESLPVVNNRREKQVATQVSHWVNAIEKKSIELSLEYKFLYQTDISDCYGSIYTHTIPWAIHTKEISKKKNMRGYDKLFGNQIDHHIQAMNYGQTNGIPQGSELMNFVAEIILGYADLELSKKLKVELKNKKYHILRYRDDYRIFVNDISDGDKILKCISEILLGLGFRLNVNKTNFSDNVISGSIKDDKMYSLALENVPKKFSESELLRHLIITQQIGTRFPNSGSLTKRLSKIFDAVKPSDFRFQEEVILSLLVDITYNNPRTIPQVAAIISQCTENLDKKKKIKFLKILKGKICTLSNTGILEIWIQRMCVKLEKEFAFNETLCKIVYGKNIQLFEAGWIKNSDIKKIISSNNFFENTIFQKLMSKISKKEVQMFGLYYN